jgi:hypothetical protein
VRKEQEIEECCIMTSLIIDNPHHFLIGFTRLIISRRMKMGPAQGTYDGREMRRGL